MSQRPTPLLLAALAVSAVCAACAAFPATAAEPSQLQRNDAQLLLDYQVVKVKGDEAIDLMGFHYLQQVAPGLSVGAGFFAPLVRGVYGGFTAFDVTAQGQWRLAGPWFATAGLSLGGGAGGRSVENAKSLSGTGGFYKLSAGVGYDLGPAAVGLNLARMHFRRSAIDGTQANVFVSVPFSYLTGPFDRHGERLSADDATLAAASASERMLTLVLDNFHQLKPQGSYTGNFNLADLQFAQFYARHSYWFAELGVGYRGMPLYNQVMGGLGQRWPLTERVTLYGQLGVGSGGYAPEKIDTDAGLLLYPRVAAEYALSPDLGLALTAGYLAAPKGSSRNVSVGLAITQHMRGGRGDNASAPRYQAYRVGLFQQTDVAVRFRGENRGHLGMIGIQAEALLNERWYLPLQASVATTTYLGYPGYGELLVGAGAQTLLSPGDRIQGFAEMLVGTNVHGLALKAGAGLRLGLAPRTALRLSAGHMEARSAAGNRFRTHSVALGLDYAFSMPTW